METALFADPAARIIRGGLLLPFGGELSKPSVSKTEPVKFAPGTVDLPPDPSVVTLNRDHSQHYPIGRATSLQETADGVLVEFAVARTPDGDKRSRTSRRSRQGAVGRDP